MIAPVGRATKEREKDKQGCQLIVVGAGKTRQDANVLEASSAFDTSRYLRLDLPAQSIGTERRRLPKGFTAALSFFWSSRGKAFFQRPAVERAGCALHTNKNTNMGS